MMTALFLLKAIRVKNSLFSEMTTGFTRFPQVLVNIKVREKHPFESIDELVQVSKIVERELSGNGRLLLRYSGTENLARVMIEGEDQNAIEGQASRLADIIRRKLG